MTLSILKASWRSGRVNADFPILDTECWALVPDFSETFITNSDLRKIFKILCIPLVRFWKGDIDKEAFFRRLKYSKQIL